MSGSLTEVLKFLRRVIEPVLELTGASLSPREYVSMTVLPAAIAQSWMLTGRYQD